MESRSFRISVIFLCLVGVVPIGRAHGGTYVIGGKALPWKEAVWDEADPDAAVGVIEFERRPGWILPVEIDTAENIASKIFERGGGVSVPNVPLSREEKDALVGIVNGDPAVAFERKSTPAKKVNSYGILLDIDLGARLGVDRIRFFPRMSEKYPYSEYFMRAYELYLNDGLELTEEGNPIYHLAVREEKNTEPVVDVRFPLQYVRYIRIKSITEASWEIDEVQVFGAGFVPTATYISKVFDLGDAAIFGRIWWHQKKVGTPSKSKVIVRTRTGTDDTPLVYYRKLAWGEEVEVSKEEYYRLDPDEQGEIRYFAKDGSEVSKKVYYSLPPEERGEVKYYRTGGEVPFDREGLPITKAMYDTLSLKGRIELDRENWSSWSSPYDYREGGVFIVSPCPRRYFQFRIDFESRDLDAAGMVDSIAFQFFVPPIARRIVAEISPRKVVAGEPTRFTYAVRPTIREGVDTGFDRLEILTPVKVDTVEAVRIDGDEVKFEVVEVDHDHFTVGFPKVTSDRLVEVVFRCEVLRYGTTFLARAFDSAAEEVKQPVVAGDATSEIDTDDISVHTALGGALIRKLEVRPDPFIPGSADATRISWDLLQLTRPVPFYVDIYDISGRLVRRFQGRGKSGTYFREWDGRCGGKLVPPGVYIVRVRVETDSGREEKFRTLTLVY